MSTELLERVKRILQKGDLEIKIDLSNEGLRDKDIHALVNLLRESGKEIKFLNLYRNAISNEGAKLLASLLNIREIDVGLNRIGDEGAKALIANSDVNELGLYDNPINDSCVSFILENTKQTYLCISGTKITLENILKIEEVVKRNKHKYLEEHKKSPRVARDIEATGIFRTKGPHSPEDTGRDKKSPSPGRPEKTLEMLFEERKKERAKQDAEFLEKLSALKAQVKGEQKSSSEVSASSQQAIDLIQKAEDIIRESTEQDEGQLEKFKTLQSGRTKTL